MRQYPRALILCAYGIAAGLSISPLMAQTISPSISGSLAEQSDTAGLESNFGQGASIGQTFHLDVTDQTHSDLSASAMTPEDRASALGTAGGFVGANGSARSGSSFGARSGAVSGFETSGFGRMEARDADGFGQSAGGAAFRVTMGASARALGNAGHPSASNSHSSETGTLLGSQPTQTGEGNGYAETATSYASSNIDPVLMPVNGGSSADLFGVPILIAASPLAEASSFFNTENPLPAQYQFDDGVTPQLFFAPLPGRLLTVNANYSPADNGFPDSTLGHAGLPLETAELHAYGDSAPEKETVFPPVSDGTVFGIRGGISRNLFAHPKARGGASIEGQLNRLYEMRIMNGMNVTDAETKRAEALALYRRNPNKKFNRAGAFGSRQSNGSGINDVPAAMTVR